jgi:hypothetical protein
MQQQNETRYHTLSVRMSAEDYRRLRDYAYACEIQSGTRTTHQDIILNAMRDKLNEPTNPPARIPLPPRRRKAA